MGDYVLFAIAIGIVWSVIWSAISLSGICKELQALRADYVRMHSIKSAPDSAFEA